MARSFLFSIFFVLSSPGAPMHAPINQTRLPKKEKREDTKTQSDGHPPPCARWPGTSLGSWLAGHCPWVLAWTGACYWHGVGGFMFNLPSQNATV